MIKNSKGDTFATCVHHSTRCPGNNNRNSNKKIEIAKLETQKQNYHC